MMDQLKVLALALFLVLTGIGIGSWMHHYQGNPWDGIAPTSPESVSHQLMLDMNISFQILQDEIPSAHQRIKEAFNKAPHHHRNPDEITALEGDFQEANWLRRKFQEFGSLDRVDIVSHHNVRLPMRNHNRIYLLDASGRIHFNITSRSSSGNGIVRGKGLVYVHYGREKDFDYVFRQQGINITGKIILARYNIETNHSTQTISSIVTFAQNRGASGLILFPGSQDFQVEKHESSVLDDDPDALLLSMATTTSADASVGADPLTPYSVLEEHQDFGQAKILLVQLIRYEEAQILYKALKEQRNAVRVPLEWEQEGFNNTYYQGPDFREADWEIKLHVTSIKTTTIYNTVGILKGKEEPDRYVIIGSHRDSRDPYYSSRTILEMVLVFGRLRKTRGWKPRRSLIFCSWAPKDLYGLSGSREWLKEHFKTLSQRAVAYLNLDDGFQTTSNGRVWNNFPIKRSIRGMLSAHPILESVLVESSKRILMDQVGTASVKSRRVTRPPYEMWVNTFPDLNSMNGTSINRSKMLLLDDDKVGSADVPGFTRLLGIPSVGSIICCFQKEEVSDSQEAGLVAPPTDRSATAASSSSEEDESEYQRAVTRTRLWTEIARNLTESVLLPMELEWYGSYLREAFDHIKSRHNERPEAMSGLSLRDFERSIVEFSEAAKSFRFILKTFQLNSDNITSGGSALEARRLNDQLTQLGRYFVHPLGPSNFRKTSSSSTFFSDLINILDSNDHKLIKEHLADITLMIHSAARSLDPNFV